MELAAKVRGGKYVIYDETNRKIVEVQKLFLKNGQMRVVGEDGALLFSIAKNRDQILVEGEFAKEGPGSGAGDSDGKRNGIRTMTAKIRYEEDEKGNVIQENLFRPPMAESLVLETSWGDLKLVQNQKREFEVFLQEKKIGEMSHMMSMEKKIRVISQELPEEAYGLVLGLGMYMLREDDVEIV